MRVRWQHVVRIVLALFAVGFAAAVYMAIRERQPAPASDARAPRTDPKAIVESTRGESLMARGTEQDFKIEYDRLLTYEDGTLRFEKVKIVVPHREGRDFVVSGQRAVVTNQQKDVTIEGNVQLLTSDGLSAATESATYQSADGIVRVPGAVQFAKERMSGQGMGATFDRERDVLSLLKDAHVVVAPDPETGRGHVDVTSESAVFARTDRYLQFDNAVRLTRDETTVEADHAVAHLAADEDRLEHLELHGASRVRTATTAAGSLQEMSSRDMSLVYGPDGRLLRQATLSGGSAMQLAGPPGQRGRRLSAESINFTLADDGATVTSLTAREKVDLEIPAENDTAPTRRIRSTSLEGSGEGGKGLTAVRFLENVEFTEQRAATKTGPALDRRARSRTLDAVMQPGLGGIERATFAGGVTFHDGDTDAAAPDAIYDLAKGSLHLQASSSVRATMSDPRASINAQQMDLSLESKALAADGDVRSELKGSKGPEGAATAQKRPSMLRDDQPVYVTAKQLAYSGSGGTAQYTGDASLWQGETSIKAGTIALDDQQGNLSAKTGVRSTLRLQDTDPKTKKVEQKTTVATAEDFVFDNSTRRATYTTNARMVGPEGDLRATKIELYLAPTGNALERLEAYDAVTLRSEGRTSSGARLTYFAADARYVMGGVPVRVLEQLAAECRETLGRILTFYRSTDTIQVENEQDRTQTTSGGKCPGPPPVQ
jgi:LPS export ABC transporter protein LptC